MRASLRWLSFLLLTPVQAQELVINGGFEEHRRCPTRSNERPARSVAHLKTIGGMPGYFHACSELMGTPGNWAGAQEPYEGEAYVGLVLTAHGGNECAVREFVQLELSEPLVNGGKYLLSFHVSLADLSGYMTDRIGACFSTMDRSGKRGVSASFGQADVDNPINRFVADTSGWMKVEGIYNAHGGERYIQIGNFQLCDRTSRKAVTSNRGDGLLHNMKKRGSMALDPDLGRSLRRRMLAAQAYAYVDAVSLIPLGTTTPLHELTAAEGCTVDPGMPAPVDDLVPDPKFDNNVPSYRSTWKNASGGTPDLLDGRTGIYLYSAVNRDHREYIHTRLKQRLDPCGIYAVRMRVLRDRTYGYAVDRVGVALTDHFIKDRERDLLPFAPAWELCSSGIMDDTHNWTTLCGEVSNADCARDLVIGNFTSDDRTTIVQRDAQGGPFAYYLVDDVSLWRTGTVEGCTAKCPQEIEAVPAVADSVPPAQRWPLILRFAVDDHVPGDDLLPTAEELFHALAQHPQLKVTITGHTDASGNEEANMRLAEKRAKAVRGELVRLGVPAQQLEVAYQGSKEPVATNSTEEGRALNRRVEIALAGPGE